MAQVPGINTQLYSLPDVSRATGSLLTPEIRQGAFDGAAEGINTIGRAVAGLGETGQRILSVVQDYRERKRNFQDQVTEAEIFTQLETEFENYRGGLPGTSEDKWVSGWRDKADKLLSKYGPEQFSPDGLKRFQLQKLKTLGEHARQLTSEAVKSSYARGVNVRVERADSLWTRDPEEAAGEIGKLVDEGAVTPAFAKTWLEGKRKETRDNTLTMIMQADARAFRDDLEESLKPDGADTEFTKDLNPVEKAEWLSRARTAARQADVDQDEAIEQAILTGEITTPERIRELAEGLPEKQILSLIGTFKEREPLTESGRAKYLENRTNLQAWARKFDPSKDVQDKEYWKFIEATRRMMPEGDRNELLSEVRAKRKAFVEGQKFNASSPAMSEALDQLKYQFDHNGLGTWKKYDRSGKLESEDPAARGKAATKYADMQKALTEWGQKNPDDSRDPAKVFGKLNELLQNDTEVNRANSAPDRAWWQFWKPSGGSTPAPAKSMPATGMDMKRQIEEMRVAPVTPAAKPEVTPPANGKESASIRFNNPGAQYPGPSSEKFGATHTETIGGGHKIAVFPDAESGAAGQFDLLDRAYTGRTLRDAIAKWSGGNHVESYLATIRENTGLSPDTMLTKDMLRDPAIAIPLVRAMARHEAGKEYPMTEAQWRAAHARAFNS